MLLPKPPLIIAWFSIVYIIRLTILDANLVCDDVGLGWHTDVKQCNFSILDANLVCDDVGLGLHTDIKQT